MLVTITADQVIHRFQRQLAELGEGKAKRALKRALDHTGRKAKTQVVRALTVQTGLKRPVIIRAVKEQRTSDLTYSLRTSGGDVSLKYFGARETRKGVSAAPWNSRRTYDSTFLKGGRFPKRVPLAMNGQVFRRVGKSKLPIVKVKSGLYIPTEMVTGRTKAAWDELIKSDLAPRVEHEITRLLP